jgi:hypothetical protein
MDNYNFAEIGVEKASKLLEIEEPEIFFFTTESANHNDVNAIFFKEDYSIGFNSSWVEQANTSEILLTAFHGTRHAFQYSVINKKYSGKEMISPELVAKWKQEFSEYEQPKNLTRD